MKKAKEYTLDDALTLANDLIDWLAEDTPDNVLFKEFIYIKKRIHYHYVSQLETMYPEFADLMDIARGIQEQKIVKYGLLKVYNGRFCEFMLVNNHGYSSINNNNQSQNELKIKIEGLGTDKIDEL